MAEQSFFEKWSDMIRRMAMPSTLVCPVCDGQKRIGGMRYAATGTLTDLKPCSNCDGRGYVSHMGGAQ